MTGTSGFEPPWWLRGPHLQTLWGPLLRRSCPVSLRRERVELADGDFLDLDWGSARAGPLVLVLHGLEGSSRSPYACGLLDLLSHRGYRAVVMHFRGCSGEPNRLPRTYHSGETSDLAAMLDRLHGHYPERSIFAVGYSLGGNVLLKYLGERGEDAIPTAAVAVSVPFLLHLAAARMERGLSRLYQWQLLGSLRRSLARKFHTQPAPFDLRELARCRNFRAFDDRVTAPLHGFAGVADYYARASCRPYLRHIARPTLIVHARDDPFMTPEAVPAAEELSRPVRLELSERGGHVGFVYGRWPWRARYWLEERILEFLADQPKSR